MRVWRFLPGTLVSLLVLLFARKPMIGALVLHSKQKNGYQDMTCKVRLALRSDCDSNVTFITEEVAWQALERLEALDEKLGHGVGATRERKRLNSLVKQWEEQCVSSTEIRIDTEDVVDPEDDDTEVEEEFDESTESEYWDSSKFVVKHLPEDNVAIFGGNPARRRQVVEKRLSPFRSLEQYGTPHDVGPSDSANLLRKISAGKYDVVYLWTRFNCHASRGAIREACQRTGTRFEEVESLSYIR